MQDYYSAVKAALNIGSIFGAKTGVALDICPKGVFINPTEKDPNWYYLDNGTPPPATNPAPSYLSGSDDDANTNDGAPE